MSNGQPNLPQGQQPPAPTASPPPVVTPPPQTALPPPDDGSHKQALYDNLSYSTEEFDKTLLYVMSGMLAVSFAFIEKIIPLEDAVNKSILLWGWILLCIGIGIYLLSHFILPFLYMQAIRLYSEHVTPEQRRNRMITNAIVQIANVAMLAITITGSIFIMYFIKANFNEQREKKGAEKALKQSQDIVKPQDIPRESKREKIRTTIDSSSQKGGTP